MLRLQKSVAALLVVVAVVLVVGVVAAPPAHKKRSTVIDRGPPEHVSNRRYYEPHPYESRCVHQGGICRYSRECPKGQLTSMKGLCPEQQSFGVECCYARPSYTNLSRKSRNSRYNGHRQRTNRKNGSKREWRRF